MVIIAEANGIYRYNTMENHAERRLLEELMRRGNIPDIITVYGEDQNGNLTNGRPCMYCLKEAQACQNKEH